MELTYILQKQHYGSVQAFTSMIVEDELVFSFENSDDDMAVKIVSYDSFFCLIKGGKCKFPKKALKGEISVSVITSDGTIPCTGLIAIPMENGAVMVLPNAKEVLSRLQKAERDISSLIESRIALEKKYNGLESRIAKLFDGHNF